MRSLPRQFLDPLTNGHLDLIERASALFGEVVVAVLQNPASSRPSAWRNALARSASTAHLNGIEVISFDGLTVNCAVTHQADLILRGLRAMSDFEYELQIAHTNRSLSTSWKPSSWQRRLTTASSAVPSSRKWPDSADPLTTWSLRWWPRTSSGSLICLSKPQKR